MRLQHYIVILLISFISSLALAADYQAKEGQLAPDFEIIQMDGTALAFDHGKVITDRYTVWGTPTEFIIDINGIIQHRDKVPSELTALLAQWNTITKTEKIVKK